MLEFYANWVADTSSIRIRVLPRQEHISELQLVSLHVQQPLPVHKRALDSSYKLRTSYNVLVEHQQKLKSRVEKQLTGRSIRIPMGTTDAISVSVRFRIFFSRLVSFWPNTLRLRRTKEAPTSVPNRHEPLHISYQYKTTQR